MALIKFGGGIVDARGSVAGNVFARNRGGNYARGKTMPINPNTAAQQAVRNMISQLAPYWSQTLTPAERQAWNDYAQAIQVTNRLGESMYLSGFNQFVRGNSAILRAGGTIVEAGPTTLSLPEADAAFSVTISEATQQLTVTFDDTAAWCDEDGAAMLIYQGQPQNAGRSFFDGPYLFADSIDGDSVSPPSSTAAVACSKVVTEGQKVWVRARIVRADGRLSAPFRCSATVAA